MAIRATFLRRQPPLWAGDNVHTHVFDFNPAEYSRWRQWLVAFRAVTTALVRSASILLHRLPRPSYEQLLWTVIGLLLLLFVVFLIVGESRVWRG